jgi:predicted RNase H-like nuclease (RuvC/YqgF family)
MQHLRLDQRLQLTTNQPELLKVQANFEAKKSVIREFKVEIAEWRRRLEWFAVGWRNHDRLGDGSWIDTTESEVQQLKANIAEHARCIVALERRLDCARYADL